MHCFLYPVRLKRKKIHPKQHMAYEHKEILQHVAYEHKEILSHGDMPQHSMFSPLFEEDFLCNQAHQHHDEESMPDDIFVVDKTHDVQLEDEICISSSYDQQVQSYKSDSENSPTAISDQIFDKRGVIIFECEQSSKLFVVRNNI